MSDQKPTMRSWFGLAEQFDFAKARWLGLLLTVIVALLFVLAVMAAFKILIASVFGGLPNGTSASFGLTGIIVAMIGAPFVVWRTMVAQKQTDVAEQGMITDRITKAVEGLGAEKTINRLGRDRSYTTLNQTVRDFEWQDDPSPFPTFSDDHNQTAWQSYLVNEPLLEVRIGALYALERIAFDSARDHIQIMEILCAYVRENAPSKGSEKKPKNYYDHPYFYNPTRDWALTLKPPRVDIQVALDVIGRRTDEQISLERKMVAGNGELGYRLDFRHTCLQGANLSGKNYDNAMFNESYLDGALLNDASFNQVDFYKTHLKGINAYNVAMRHSRLWQTTFDGSHLENVDMKNARFFSTWFEFSDLHSVELENSEGFDSVTLQGACLRQVNLSGTKFNFEKLEHVFADASVILPDGHGPSDLNWPKHWNSRVLTRNEHLNDRKSVQTALIEKIKEWQEQREGRNT